MAIRHLLTPVLVLTAMAPVVAGNASATVRGKLLPDLPQHLEFAERDLRQGEVASALAHISLVVMDKPIRYQLGFRGVGSELEPICKAAFEDATAMWERAFPGEIRFEEADGEERPDLIVYYQPDVVSKGVSVAGLVSWKRKVSGSVPISTLSADLQLRTTQPNGRNMTLDHMRHTAAHELGHILGLDDSPFYGDIMGPLDLKHPAHDFEASELHNLREIRASAYELMRTAMSKK